MSSITSPIYRTACLAIRAGINFIPIFTDGAKRPAIRWKHFQQKRSTLRDARRWFWGKDDRGIAFLTGAISGNLEMLDFDSQSIYEQFVERMQMEGLSKLLEDIEQGYN